jgi:hypothetical protein
MNNEQWEQIVENLRAQFKGVEVFEEEIEQGMEGSRGVHADIVIFNTPRGRFRLVRESRPVVLEKKQLYSHRPGDTARTEYKFSDTEFTHKLKLYRENDDLEWEEVTLDQLGL